MTAPARRPDRPLVVGVALLVVGAVLGVAAVALLLLGAGPAAAPALPAGVERGAA